MNKKVLLTLAAIGVAAYVIASNKKKDAGFVTTKSGKKVKPVIQVEPLENISEAQYKAASQKKPVNLTNVSKALTNLFTSRKKAQAVQAAAAAIKANPFLR